MPTGKDRLYQMSEDELRAFLNQLLSKIEKLQELVPKLNHLQRETSAQSDLLVKMNLCLYGPDGRSGLAVEVDRLNQFNEAHVRDVSQTRGSKMAMIVALSSAAASAVFAYLARKV